MGNETQQSGGQASPSLACSRLSAPATEAATWWTHNSAGQPVRVVDDYICGAIERKCLEAQTRVDELSAWAMQAAPMLSAAACIVIDDSPQRLSEIEGVRAILELCPVDFHSENDQSDSR